MQAAHQALQEASQLVLAVQHGGDLNVAVAAYQALRKAVSKAKSSRDVDVRELLVGFGPKVPALTLLVEVYVRKPLYKKQVHETLETLLHVEAWVGALCGESALCADLPDELASLLPSQSAVSYPELASDLACSSASDPAVPIPFAPPTVRHLLSHPASSAGSASAQEIEIKEASAPSNESMVRDDALRAAIIAAKDAGKLARGWLEISAPYTPAAPRDARAYLKDALLGMAKLGYKGTPRDDAVEAFTHFSKAVTMLAQEGGRERDRSKDPLDIIEPKVEVVSFLLEFCVYKAYRSRIRAIFVRLWGSLEWRETLKTDAEIMSSIHLLFPGLCSDASENGISSATTFKAAHKLARAPTEIDAVRDEIAAHARKTEAFHKPAPIAAQIEASNVQAANAGLTRKRRWRCVLRWEDLSAPARTNPMQYSEWKNESDTIADLRTHEQEKQGRKVVIQVGDGNGIKINQFNACSISEAIALLEVRDG